MTKIRIGIMLLMFLTAAFSLGAPQQDTRHDRGAQLDAIVHGVTERLKNGEKEAREQARKELVQILSAVEGLIAEAATDVEADDPSKEWMTALDRIRNAARARLFLLRMDPDARSKVAALSRTMPDLYDRIGSSEWTVREKLARDLAASAEPGAVPILAGLLDDDSLQVKKYAVKGLGAIGGERAVEPLLKLFGSLPLSFPATERFMAEESGNLTDLVIVTLGRLGNKRASPALAKVLKAGSAISGTGSAIQALGEIGDTRALPYLIEVLNGNRTRFVTMRNGKSYMLMDSDLAMDAVLKMTNQPRAEYGMTAPGTMQPRGGIYEILFDSEEARSQGIAKLKKWWDDNRSRFVSSEDQVAFAKEISAQNLRLPSGSSGQPVFPPVVSQLRSYAASGDLDTLLKEAIRIMKTEPQLSFMARMELIAAYRQKNRLDELGERLQKELKEEIQNVPLRVALGEIFRTQGRPLPAIEMYEEAMRLNPNDGQIISSLGSIYYSLGEYQRTIDLLKRASALSAGSITYYPMMANSYVRLGRKDEALKLADEARKIVDTQNTPGIPGISYGMLGDIYQAVGRYDEAVKALEKAIELAPAALAPTLKTRLATVYQSAGKPELAEKTRGDMIPEASRIGKNAADFGLQDLSGKTVHLSDFKGKTVLLDFWATWCAPCVAEIPHLEALHKKYKDKGLVVIGLNTEGDHAKVKQFAENKISYAVLLDAEAKSREYGVQGIPTKIYIDATGRIRHRDIGYMPGQEASIEEKIRKLLDEN